ncbi:hypothetical protein [Clostridium sp. HBUAS56010]|uniref:hypothetical protein n=1 Tax=Clostridium sp. HBUAS56010 TaxID=2571127 RepID=UPI0011782889|nr:hypothetical protein [Clostridium sp. HBUAS56010]
MTDNELLLALSNMIDKKLKSIKEDITGIKLHLENVTDVNIQLLAENYVPAAKKYESSVSKIETMQSDIDLLKKVVTEHSTKLQQIS